MLVTKAWNEMIKLCPHFRKEWSCVILSKKGGQGPDLVTAGGLH